MRDCVGATLSRPLGRAVARGGHGDCLDKGRDKPVPYGPLFPSPGPRTDA